MSRLSKIFLIAAPVSFFLAFAIHLFRLQRMMSELEGASEEWKTIVVEGYASWDVWNITIDVLIVGAFSCIFLAILHWKRDRPHQKLFPE